MVHGDLGLQYVRRNIDVIFPQQNATLLDLDRRIPTWNISLPLHRTTSQTQNISTTTYLNYYYTT